jgi:parvulin-like peptidyl-prolyl isomerase
VTSRTELRPFIALAAVLAAAVVLNGCGALDPAAASVGDREISRREFTRELQALRDNRPLQRLAGGGEAEGREAEGAERVNPLAGEGREGTFTADLAARWLERLILHLAVDREFERRHLRLTAQDRRDARSDDALAADFGGNTEVVRKFPGWFRTRLAERDARLRVLQRAVRGETPDEADALEHYRSHPEDVAQACLSHILVETRAAAEGIRRQIVAGGDFATIARQRSEDPGSAPDGGALGCQPLGSFVPGFKVGAYRAPLNTVSEPVQSNFGWHLILVTSRQVPEFATVRDTILQQLRRNADSRFQEILSTDLERARVKVDPRYGKFTVDEQGPRVTPPVVREAPTDRRTSVSSTPVSRG